MLNKFLCRILPIFFACLCLSVASAADPMNPVPQAERNVAGNLVLNGDFSAAPLPSLRLPGWDGVTSNCEIKQFADEGHYIALRNDSHARNSFCRQSFALEEDWKALRITIWASVDVLTTGTEQTWHDCRLALDFNAEDKPVKYAHPFIWKEAAPGWKRYSKTVSIPQGYTSAAFTLALFNAVGAADFAYFSVEALDGTGNVVGAAGGQGGTATAQARAVPQLAFSPEQAAAWDQEPLEKNSPVRETIYLNGVWNIGMADAGSAAEHWGTVRVPGSWKAWSNLPGLLSSGNGWNAATEDAWYARQIEIPQHWEGRRIVLDFNRISTDADVYIDESFAGAVTWPGGLVDITDVVQAGQTHQLSVLVNASLIDKDIIQYMGPEAEQVIRRRAVLKTKGITGDVKLSVMPLGGRIEDLRIVTSTQEKTFGLNFAVPTAAGENVAISAQIVDPQGYMVKTFHADAIADADGLLALEWEWHDPRLWDIEDPYLYRLKLTARAPGLEDRISQSFGFREFRIEGRDFYLNGTPIRLRPIYARDLNGNIDAIRNEIQSRKESGFNVLELSWRDVYSRGAYDYDVMWAAEADRIGMLIICRVVDVGETVSRDLIHENMVSFWRDAAKTRLAPLLNHPSIVMWVFGGNRFGFGQDQNPEIIGDRKQFEEKFSSWLVSKRSGLKAMEVLRELDPTRPSFSHAGTFVGDVYTINNYLNMIPLQEREEWLSRWAVQGDMPFMSCEFGLPLGVTFTRGRKGYTLATTSEPLITEFTASYLGPRAYDLETDAYRNYIREYFIEGQDYHSNHLYHWQNPDLVELTELFIENTYRSWRTAGVTGGMVPWGLYGMDNHASRTVSGFVNGKMVVNEEMIDAPAPWEPGRRGTYNSRIPQRSMLNYVPGAQPNYSAVDVLLENNAATLAWIAGKAERFTDKTHVFSAGETVEKQVALINDERQEQPYQWVLQATLGGEVLYDQNGSGTIAPATNLLEVIRFDLPEAIGAGTETGVIELTAQIGTRSHTDAFEFRVMEKPAGVWAGTLYVADPQGLSSGMLEALGYKVEPWQGQEGMLIVGRHALEEDGTLLQSVKAHLLAGGRAILMAQNPEWMETHLGLRSSKFQSRRVFPIGSVPQWAQIDSEFLRDWRGTGTLLPPTNAPISTTNELLPQPPFGWRWGNHGTVTSAAVEKPHFSAMTPLLEAEFDLAYSPLLQLPYGQGVLFLCTLDLEDNAQIDPAAAMVLEHLIDYAHTVEVREPQVLGFIGGGEDEAVLKQIGVKYRTVATLPEAGGLAVVSADVVPEPQVLERFLDAGGRLLVMPSRKAGQNGWGLDIVEQADFSGSIDVPAWQAATGISPSDLRWRSKASALLIGGGSELGAGGLLGRRQVGAGEIIFSQLDPQALNAEEKTYMRYTRWRQHRAISQLLANLGASFVADDVMLNFSEVSALERIALDGTWQARMTLPIEPSPGSNAIDPGISATAAALIADDNNTEPFEEVKVLSPFEFYGPEWEKDGEVVYRRTITIPQEWAGGELTLSLGPIDDFDDTFFNGVLIGRTDINSPRFWVTPRKYTIPAELVKAGESVITVRVFDHGGQGGFTGKAEQLYLTPDDTLPQPDAPAYYHPDYRTDFPMGDDPHRYYRW